MKVVGPGPYPPKKSGGARAQFYPISTKKWWGPGPTGPYPSAGPEIIFIIPTDIDIPRYILNKMGHFTIKYRNYDVIEDYMMQ